MTLSVEIGHTVGALQLDVAFEAPPGVTVLFGSSGSGKTSVVNAVAGLLRPDRGRVSVNGWELFDTEARRWLPPHKRRLGYIFQEGRLFPHLTVRQNLVYGRWFAPAGERRESLDKVVEVMGIGHLLPRRPGALSGGEKQRVAIGRALLAGPRLLLADEPLAALDEARKAEILPFFERLRDAFEVPILYVTHSAAEVARLATTVVVLEGGRVVRQGAADAVLSDPDVMPTGVRAAGALLVARVVCHHADGLTELDAGGVPMFLPHIDRETGHEVRLRIAAHEVILSREAPQGLSALNILPGRVVAMREGAGPGMLISLDTAAGTLLARVTRRSAEALALAPGACCHAVIKTVGIAPLDVGGV